MSAASHVSSTATRVSAIGRCIYCDSDKPPLTDEHLIAQGFGARFVLPKATCEECRVKTGRFEESVLRGMVWPLRAHYGMRGTKRPLPKTIPTEVIALDGSRARLELAPDAVPVKAALPIFKNPPGFLVGRDRNSLPEMDFGFLYDPNAAEQLGALGIEGTSILIRGRDFARMLAKMAHCAAVMKFGLNSISGLLGPIVTGEDQNWPFYVGADLFSDAGEIAHTIGVETIVRQRDRLLLARVRLFGQQSSPTYLVVVGWLAPHIPVIGPTFAYPTLPERDC